MHFVYVFILQFLYNSTCFEGPFRSSSGVLDFLYTAAEYRKTRTPDDERNGLSKHVELYKNCRINTYRKCILLVCLRNWLWCTVHTASNWRRHFSGYQMMLKYSSSFDEFSVFPTEGGPAVIWGRICWVANIWADLNYISFDVNKSRLLHCIIYEHNLRKKLIKSILFRDNALL